MQQTSSFIDAQCQVQCATSHACAAECTGGVIAGLLAGPLYGVGSPILRRLLPWIKKTEVMTDSGELVLGDEKHRCVRAGYGTGRECVREHVTAGDVDDLFAHVGQAARDLDGGVEAALAGDAQVTAGVDQGSGARLVGDELQVTLALDGALDGGHTVTYGQGRAHTLGLDREGAMEMDGIDARRLDRHAVPDHLAL